MPFMSKITHLRLDNFTSFAAFDQPLSSGVNILIGANGTGKTHLLKTLYAACAVTVGEDRDKGFALKLRNVFNPHEGNIGRLVRRGMRGQVKHAGGGAEPAGRSHGPDARGFLMQETLQPVAGTQHVCTDAAGDGDARVSVTRQGNASLSARFSAETVRAETVHVTGQGDWEREELSSVYIPVKEMLAHAPGFLSTAARREIAFEEVYLDVIKRAFLPRLKGPLDAAWQQLLDGLQAAIAGQVVTRGEHFFLKDAQGELEFTLLAEGLRKLALVSLLVQNGPLFNGSVLFWDEPEANLNPALLGLVVDVLLRLQRMGVQVFLATHNYVLLKEFDLRSREQDQIRYLSLFRDEMGAVQTLASDDLSGVDPNLIIDTYTSLYDREMARSLGMDMGQLSDDVVREPSRR